MNDPLIGSISIFQPVIWPQTLLLSTKCAPSVKVVLLPSVFVPEKFSVCKFILFLHTVSDHLISQGKQETTVLPNRGPCARLGHSLSTWSRGNLHLLLIQHLRVANGICVHFWNTPSCVSDWASMPHTSQRLSSQQLPCQGRIHTPPSIWMCCSRIHNWTMVPALSLWPSGGGKRCKKLDVQLKNERVIWRAHCTESYARCSSSEKLDPRNVFVSNGML